MGKRSQASRRCWTSLLETSGRSGIKQTQLNKASAVENDSSNDININIDINVRERSNHSAAVPHLRRLPCSEMLFAAPGRASL